MGCFINVCTHEETHKLCPHQLSSKSEVGFKGKFTVMGEVEGGRVVWGRRRCNMGSIILGFGLG